MTEKEREFVIEKKEEKKAQGSKLLSRLTIETAIAVVSVFGMMLSKDLNQSVFLGSTIAAMFCAGSVRRGLSEFEKMNEDVENFDALLNGVEQTKENEKGGMSR